MRRFRASLTGDDHAARSEQIVFHLRKREEFRAARTIHSFWPMTHRGEPDIRPALLAALKDGKQVWLPIVDGDQLLHGQLDRETLFRKGAFGQEEPVTTLPVSDVEADLILIPGLAIDHAGNRIGYGAGHYDRFLSRNRSADSLLVAVVFDGQIHEALPAEEHDIRMDAVVTESGWTWALPDGGFAPHPD